MKITKNHFHNSIESGGDKISLTLRGIDWFKGELQKMTYEAKLMYGELPKSELINVLILDTETTGLNDDDEVIELCIAQIKLVKGTYAFYSFDQIVDELNEPEKDLKKILAPEIEELTGLTTEMIKGSKIDKVRARDLIAGADLIIAHNANFDRKQIIKLLGDSISVKIWGCSYQQIPWKKLGFLNSKQEILLMFHGIVFQGHRADSDVFALAWMLSKFCYFEFIVKDLKNKKVLVSAVNSPFEVKDILSQKYGFKFDGESKVWRAILNASDFEIIKDQLALDAYKGRPSQLVVKELRVNMFFAPMSEIVS